MRNNTVGAGYRRGGVVRPDDLAAVAVIDADNAIEVAGDDCALCCRNGGRHTGVAEGSALAADILLHVTPQHLTRHSVNR